jgi:large subunit ribosomal protein L6
MSRIGKLEINIPSGVTAEINAGILTVKGPKGELKRDIRDEVRFNIAESKITSEPARNDKFSKSL